MAGRTGRRCACVIVAVTLGACTTSVPGQAIRGSDSRRPASSTAKPAPGADFGARPAAAGRRLPPRSGRRPRFRWATATSPAFGRRNARRRCCSRVRRCCLPAHRITPIRHTTSRAGAVCGVGRRLPNPVDDPRCGVERLQRRFELSWRGRWCGPAWGLQTDAAQLLRHIVRRCAGVDHDPSGLDLRLRAGRRSRGWL